MVRRLSKQEGRACSTFYRGRTECHAEGAGVDLEIWKHRGYRYAERKRHLTFWMDGDMRDRHGGYQRSGGLRKTLWNIVVDCELDVVPE